MADNTLKLEIKGFYYYSDPNSADQNMHHYPIAYFTEDNPSKMLPPLWHREKPDDNLKDAVWSIDEQKFVENDNSNQTAIIAKQSQQINNLVKANKIIQENSAKKDQEIQIFKRGMAQTNLQVGGLVTQFNQLGSKVTEGMTQMGTMLRTINQKLGSDAQNNASVQPHEEAK